MNNRSIGQEILDSIREIKSFHKGEIKLKTHTLTEPSPPKVIREKLKLSQSAFVGFMGVSPRTIQDWEQGRRQPQDPAKSLLRIAEQHPEIFIELSQALPNNRIKIYANLPKQSGHQDLTEKGGSKW